MRLARLLPLAILGLILAASGVRGEQKYWGKSYIPNVELTAQDGRKVRFYDDIIKGRIVVISFIYTSCREICPLITARLAQVYEKLGDKAGKDIQFVSISIDPANDTPQRMKEHADAFRSDERWLFLTGAKADIDLVRYRLGERSRKLTEHRSDILLRNDRTGEWARDSAFADLDRLAYTIRALDPNWRDDNRFNSKTTVSQAAAEELPGQALFVKACASCHTIGKGDRVGPDLLDVTSRRSDKWLTGFLLNPERARRNSGDLALAALMAKFPSVRMPNLQLAERDTEDLISYLKTRSSSVLAGTGKPARPRDHGRHHGAH
jgi:cytochrome oxidase Cu insertion factor (SCO1/SenC/PrrC family)/mono/diheme cytochrome c family protein